MIFSIEKNIFPIILYVNIASILSTSGYVLTTTFMSEIIYLGLFPIALLNLCLCLISSTLRVNLACVKVPILLVSFTLVSLFIVFSIVSSIETVGSSTYKWILVAFYSSTVLITFRFHKLALAFLNVMYFIAILSLILYVSFNVLDLNPEAPQFTNLNGVTYNSFFFYFFIDGFLDYRNIGIFWEPGIYATFLYLAMITQLIFKSNLCFSKIIFILTMITTFSGAAFVLVSLYAVQYFFYESNSNKRVALGFLLILMFGALITSTNFNMDSELYWKFERVFLKVNNINEMQSERLSSIQTMMQMYIEKPIFGWGMENGLTNFSLENDLAFTSTSMMYLMSFGVFGLILTILPGIGILVLQGVNFTQKICLIFGYFFIINKEPHLFFSISNLIIFALCSVVISKLMKCRTTLASNRIILR